MSDIVSDNFLSFASAAQMQTAARDHIASRLKTAIHNSGRARLLVSGGSSPRPVYEGLSQTPLDWSCVKVGLVDERWVEPNEEGSNAAFIAQTLLSNRATGAQFVSMKTPHKTAFEAAPIVSNLYAEKLNPADVCVMGMGLDGHTASWFPQSADLSAALDVNNSAQVCAVDARGCPVAGALTERMSMTLAAIMASQEIILLITGAQKRQVFEQARGKSVYDAPVKALLSAGPRLKIFWGA